MGFFVISTIGFATFTVIETYTHVSNSSTENKKVIAFYYGWYGNTTDYSQSTPYPIEDNENWWHWDYHGRGWYPPSNACSVNTPIQGWYDSSDPTLIQTHLEQAEWAGLDAFVASYWGYGSKERKNMNILLEVAKNISSSVKIAPYFEIGIINQNERTHEEIVDQFTSELSLLHDFLMNNSYSAQIWFENENPVLWVYATRKVSVEVWIDVMKNLELQNKTFFLVGDRPRNRLSNRGIFEGHHLYDVYGPNQFKVSMHYLNTLKRKSNMYDQIFVAGVTPGYNDTVVRDGNPPVAREEGIYYKNHWIDAITLNPDWISITSWNEWHEGTEIEPSRENGDLALQQTKQYIQEFKNDNYVQLQPNPTLLAVWRTWWPHYSFLLILWVILAVPLILFTKSNKISLNPKGLKKKI